MPRRTNGGNQSNSKGSSGGYQPTRRSSPTAGTSQSQPQQQQKQPGVFRQAAAIAGGVATGTAVGHAVGHALTGGYGHTYRDRDYSPQFYEEQQQQNREQGRQDPCDKEITAFLKCTQDQKEDISICEGFVEAIRQCRNYGPSALSEKQNDKKFE